MANRTLSEKLIKSGVIDVCRHAMSEAGSRIRSELKKGRRQGIETVFEKAFIRNVTAYPNWKAETQINRSKMRPRDEMRPRGRVDAILTHTQKGGVDHRIGIEFKVCEFPRLKWNSPLGSTYDVGQIAWDYAALKAYRLESAYCIALLHGGFAQVEGLTEKGLERLFHNALFADFQTALMWGGLQGKLFR